MTTTPSYLTQYDSQTQNGILNAGLNSVMGVVNSNGSVSNLVSQGFTPQAVGSYKDASGNTVQAPANTYVVSKPDGSGGSLNYFFQVDPKTGTTAPINNPSQNLTYTPGSNGGFFNQLASDIKPLVPIAETVASALIPGAAPVIAGLNAADSISKGKFNTGTLLNTLTAASGLGSFDPSTVSALNTAKQVVGGVNAVQTGNVAGMINSLLQVSGTANQDTNTAIKLINAATALKSNDIAGALNAINGLTNSVDPQVANVATSILKYINPTASSSGAGPSQNASATQSTSNTSSTQASTPTSTTSTAAPAASQSTTLTAAPVVGKITAFDPFGVKNPFLSSSEAQVSDSYATGGSIEDLLRILK